MSAVNTNQSLAAVQDFYQGLSQGESTEKQESSRRTYSEALSAAIETSFKVCPVRHRKAAEEARRLNICIAIIRQASNEGHYTPKMLGKLAPILCRRLDGQNAWYQSGQTWVESGSGLMHAVPEDE